MKFDLLRPTAIEADWERIGRLLSPAIICDDTRQAIDVFRDLMSGDMALFDIDLPGAKGVAVIEFNDGCCWLLYIGGRIAGRGRAWVSRVRTLMSYFEGIARAHDCKEMRLEGRDWSRVLADYQPTGERPGRNELRKAL